MHQGVFGIDLGLHGEQRVALGVAQAEGAMAGAVQGGQQVGVGAVQLRVAAHPKVPYAQPP